MEWVIFINHREKFSHWIFAGRTEPSSSRYFYFSLLRKFSPTFGLFFRPMHHVIFNFKSRYNIQAFIDLIYPFISYKTYLSF